MTGCFRAKFLLYHCETCRPGALVHQWGAAEYACVCVGSSGGPVEVLLSLTPGTPFRSPNQTSDAIDPTWSVPKVLISATKGVSCIAREFRADVVCQEPKVSALYVLLFSQNACADSIAPEAWCSVMQ